ncbi:hypothetical protein F511_35468 [Dorcoceras hygrometricum]|uniref:Uncharacterized protein n=1 Tax=Dorcoceras hygrometricum TaxID=472368 RepID=A0A2Z7BBM2_9LAMI|nr:hypothetical protein F511_35468 [Dorcoceras hygrometricum]
MLNMFKALEVSGLLGFLGLGMQKFLSCPRRGYFSDVPKNLVFDARSIFLKFVEQVDIHGKKRFMKHEYRLLNDILAKAITVKVGSFDAVTNECFMMMTAIHFGLKVNWSKVLFGVLKDMVDRTQKKARGYAAQIGVLLKSIPAITMGEGVPFPISKILSIKTVNTYIAMNHTIDARGQSDEPGVADVAVVKRKSKSKKKSETTDETPIEIISEVAGSNKRPAAEDSAPVIPKKRCTVKGKDSLDVVPVAQDVVPLKIIEPTPAETVVKSPAPKRISRKMRLVLPIVSDDEIILGLKDAGIDQLNFHSVQPDYLMLLQMGNTDPNKTKAGNKYEVKPQYEELSKQLGGRHSNPVVTTPTIALDFSDTTQQSASHNVAPNQKAHPKDRNARRNLLLNSAVSRFRSSSTQPPRLVGKERSSQEVSNTTKNSKNGGGINGKSR